MVFFVHRVYFKAKIVPTYPLPQRYFLQYFVNGTRRLKNALVIHQFLHVSVEVGLLLYGIADLKEKLLVNQRLDSAHGEMRHKILPVTQITQIIKSVQKIGLKVKQSLGLVVHSKPQYARHVVASEKTCAVEVHSERLMPLRHFLTSLNDGRDVVNRGTAKKLQR